VSLSASSLEGQFWVTFYGIPDPKNISNEKSESAISGRKSFHSCNLRAINSHYFAEVVLLPRVSSCKPRDAKIKSQNANGKGPDGYNKVVEK
jgi:hypothetical protein